MSQGESLFSSNALTGTTMLMQRHEEVIVCEPFIERFWSEYKSHYEVLRNKMYLQQNIPHT